MSTNGRGENWTDWTLTRARPYMDEFLQRMRNSGNVRASCQAAGIPRSTAYYWRGKFITFAKEWDEAKADAVDALDLEAWKRATEGQSDRLLMFLLQAHRPDVYSPVQKHQVKQDGDITIRVVYTDDGTDDNTPETA